MSFLETYKENLFDLRRSNPLIHLNIERVASGVVEHTFFTPNSKENLEKTLRVFKKNKKTYGLHTLLLTKSIINWTYKGREVSSPLTLQTAELIFFKGSKTPKIKIVDDAFINPVLAYLLHLNFNISCDDQEFENFIQNNNFSIKQGAWLSNFDYKKYRLVADYDEILNLGADGVLAEIIQPDLKKEPLKEKTFFPVYTNDYSQKKVISSASTGESIVIEGPPGTGKSRTIANVIAQNLLIEKSTIFVAEKRVALEVVTQLLSEKKLHHLTSTIHDSNLDKKRFVKELKDSWEYFITPTQEPRKVQFSDVPLKFCFDKLNGNVIGSELKYQALVDRINENQSKKCDIKHDVSIHFLDEWIRNSELIQKIFDRLNELGYPSFSSTKINLINQTLFKKGNLQETILPELDSLIHHIDLIQSISDKYQISLLDDLIIASSLARIISNYKEIRVKDLLKVSFRKKFFQLRKKRIKLLAKIELNKELISCWNSIWTKDEISFAIEILAENRILAKTKRKAIIKKFEQNFNQKNLEIPIEKVLLKTIDYWLFMDELNLLDAELKAEFGIQNPDIQLTIYNEIILSIEKQDHFLLELLKSQKNPDFTIYELDAIHNNLQQILFYSKTIFGEHRPTQFSNLKSQAKSLKTTEQLVELTKVFQELAKTCSAELYQFITAQSYNYQELDKTICSLGFKKYAYLDEEYSRIDNQHLTKTISDQINHEVQFCESNINQIQYKTSLTLQRFLTLLSTPAVKLSSENKVLKKKLRNGKSILTKEFSKQKQFKPIRELYESDAKLWIDVLKPILFLSPISVTEIFDINQQFDCAIFDESSQIPMEDCLPTLHRSKQIIIAGDSQQMAPSSFFKSTNSEQFSLLDHCKFEFKNFTLDYHYRSQHKELISFSNKHFYKDKMHIIDSPVKNESPLEYIQLSNRDYSDGMNKTEANDIIHYLHQFREKNKSIGIVTLSNKQAELIQKLINLDPLLDKLFEKNSNFIKPIENLQGDECDLLLISLTHGPNSSGEFSKNFGPLNQINGKKRLNVLFSRSKHKTIVFSSFTPDQIIQTDNENLILLRTFLEFTQSTMSLFKPITQDKKMVYTDPHMQFNSPSEFLSSVQQYSILGWKPFFGLTKSQL